MKIASLCRQKYPQSQAKIPATRRQKLLQTQAKITAQLQAKIPAQLQAKMPAIARKNNCNCRQSTITPRVNSPANCR